MTVTVYKLTTQDNKTRKGKTNECTWRENVTHKGTGQGDLCGPGYIHAYLSPALAVLLNPIHANISNPKLWECVVPSIDKNDRGLKIGSVSLTTIREIDLPVFTLEQRVIFAILCVEKALKASEGNVAFSSYKKNIKVFQDWAEGYKRGVNRGDKEAARAARAADAATSAAYAAARAAARAAADAARAAYSADAAEDAAAYAAADAVAYAADAVAYAADAAARADDINLVDIADEVLHY